MNTMEIPLSGLSTWMLGARPATTPTAAQLVWLDIGCGPISGGLFLTRLQVHQLSALLRQAADEAESKLLEEA